MVANLAAKVWCCLSGIQALVQGWMLDSERGLSRYCQRWVQGDPVFATERPCHANVGRRIARYSSSFWQTLVLGFRHQVLCASIFSSTRSRIGPRKAHEQILYCNADVSWSYFVVAGWRRKLKSPASQQAQMTKDVLNINIVIGRDV